MTRTYRKNYRYRTEEQYVIEELNYNKQAQYFHWRGMLTDEECEKEARKEYRRRRSHSSAPSFKYHKRQMAKKVRHRAKAWLNKGLYEKLPKGGRRTSHRTILWDYYW